MSPLEQYSDRLAQRAGSFARLDKLDARVGHARLALAAAFLTLAWGWFERGVSPAWLAAAAALFAAAVIYHHRIRGLQSLARRAVEFYQAGLDRMRGRCVEGGARGDEFSDAHHVYGADLDLFGRQSLFERLCTARTPMGAGTLAQWLLAPAPIETIRERQASIGELRGRIGLREDLAVLGEPRRLALSADALAAWAAAPGELLHGWLRVAATLAVAAAAVTAGIWALGGFAFPFLAVLVLEACLTYAYRGRVHAALSGLENAYEQLALFAALLRRIEAEPFDAPPLKALRAALSSHAQTASTTLSKLATLVNFVEARRNPFLTPLMLPLMYTLHTALAAERWRRRHGQVVQSWLNVLGEIEALQSIAAYSFERPEDPFPEFLEGGSAAFVAAALGHPLIPPQACVRNDVDLSGGTRALLVSGSNMSGKSTLLRSVGVNAVLAMAGAPVCAARLRLTPVQVGAGIRINDSLHEGSSRFYAEITRLRQLFEPARLPLLFLLDELLQGTNSSDRRIGAQGVIRALIERGAIGLVSTHDVAIADGIELAPGALGYVHFQDELRDGKLTFDFKLRAGIATKGNGIELMRAIGLDV
ncbi:MAG: mismatch repair protein [Steroidobacteraceae bacterium]